jgi:hypothetical protein
MQQGLLSLTNIESISCCQRVDIGDRPARRHVEWAKKLGELHQINKNAPANHTTRLAVVRTGIPPSRTLSSGAEISDITGYTQTIS